MPHDEYLLKTFSECSTSLAGLGLADVAQIKTAADSGAATSKKEWPAQRNFQRAELL